MAFCNSCGANLQAGAKFCPKCGGSVPAVASPSPTPVAPPPVNQGSSALKVILIVVAVVVGLGILGIGGLTFVGWRIARHSQVRTVNGEVHVQTPFGSVETIHDPQQAARNIGVDIYPGATMQQDAGASVAFGGMHTAALNFETSDPPEKVADFYRSKFPQANITSGENGHYAIISGEKDNLLTINIEPQDGKTQVHVARITK